MTTLQTLKVLLPACLLVAASAGIGQEAPQAPKFQDAAQSVNKDLEASLAELTRLREEMASEKIPLSKKLRELEGELQRLRQDYQQTSRALDGKTLELSNLRNEIKSRQDANTYLSNVLLSDFANNFESRLHITEVQRFKKAIDHARLAPENDKLKPEEVFTAQAGLLSVSLDRLEDAMGGSRFDGIAVDAASAVKQGKFVVIGPIALFRSDDGKAVGTAEVRLGTHEPAIIPFTDPEDTKAADALVLTGAGRAPVDPTLGNAHKIAETEETLIEHIKAGGPVMIPIFVLAAAALLVVLLKWFSMSFLKKSSQASIDQVLQAVATRDQALAIRRSEALGGPTGEMLSAGSRHMNEPRELIEEIMFEKVLSTRLRVQKWLPFVAISAASAPLLGLLGTVTGIMNTFKMITVFGTGDVKTLSSGISEALITTEYGLIVAIPSLLLHAFLSRKARGHIDHMEKAAIAFLNQVSKTTPDRVYETV